MREPAVCAPASGRRARLAAAVPVVALLWAGLVLGVSFLATPVKFQAPSLSLAVGLDVGRHTFAASHQVQLLLAAILLGAAALARAPRGALVLFATAAVVLLAQHLALLPVLDARAQIWIDGGTPDGPSPHVAYVALEALKVLLLIAASLRRT
ncbi:MAG TPA: hypothetical protein VNO30_13580 [Kofleriaceae bacterium]|nr:hypothetical protein [Kofleriaceae bacterium]